MNASYILLYLSEYNLFCKHTFELKDIFVYLLLLNIDWLKGHDMAFFVKLF